MPVELTKEHFISIEDLIEWEIRALRNGEPFGLTRWADSSNWIMNHGREQGHHVAYREGYLTLEHWPEYRAAFVYGAQTCDVLGVFERDHWTTQVMNDFVPELDLTGKPLVYPWCNRCVNSRREWVDEVFGGSWRTALVGNRMTDYRPWLEQHFPSLEIVQCNLARDWPDVAAAMAEFQKTQPQLALLCAGWFTSCLVGAARDAGAVAVSCGHMPDHHMLGEIVPNTEFPRGIDGNRAYCRKHFPDMDGSWYEQTREIVI